MTNRETFEWYQSDVLARAMLQIKAVELRPNNPFTWSSGWKSPMYCDNRVILGYPLAWDLVLEGMQEALATVFPGVDVLAGTATAGIPHAAALARELRLPMAYVRGSAKSHGKGKQVEGRVGQGLRAVVIEDSLSTGGSAYDAVDALRAEGMDVLGVLCIYSYDFPQALARAEASNVPAVRLVGYDTLIQTAREAGYIEEQDLGALNSWRQNPDKYGE